MNGYEFAQQYYKRLADGENIKMVNSEVLRDGDRLVGNLDVTLRFGSNDPTYTWAPKTITVTIPAPIPMPAKDGEKFYYAELCFKTMKERDDARRILNGGKDET